MKNAEQIVKSWRGDRLSAYGVNEYVATIRTRFMRQDKVETDKEHSKENQQTHHEEDWIYSNLDWFCKLNTLMVRWFAGDRITSDNPIMPQVPQLIVGSAGRCVWPSS